MESKKITVKHYLNKRAKPKVYKKNHYYPLYIQLIVYARKAQLKSRINQHLELYRSELTGISGKDKEMADIMTAGYFTEQHLDRVIQEHTFPLYHLLNDEIEVIRRIISLKDPFDNEEFTLNNFSKEYRRHTTEITDILDDHIKSRYHENLNRIFHASVDSSAEKKAFNISNYFIHYLNWDFSFSNFYEVTYEVIPSELKFIENYLDKNLLTAIKAYLAFHSKVNVLKRYLEKKEQGKITSVSYLDWVTEIKEFMMKEFVKIFGKKKGVEYLECLNDMLVTIIEGD